VSTDKIVAYEALARFDVDYACINDPVFIIQQMNMIYPNIITKRLYNILHESLNEFTVPVHFNISLPELHIFDYFKKTESIIFEITEQDKCGDNDFEELLKRKHEGFSFGLDDFGSGYSNIHYFLIDNVPFDFVKIDKQLTDKLIDTQRLSVMNRLLTMFETDLNLSVIIEGVETQERLDDLKSYGFSLIQGYLLGKPTKLDKLKR
jgi:EAL domain-containing protein (putative c-di-GMP-specific phosphodiesterase class I)